MLTCKNIYDSGKYSIALPLQHCNLQFFDIFEIGVTERVVKEVNFKHGDTLRILAENWRSGFQQCIAAGGQNF